MGPNPTKAFATRVSAAEAERIETAIEEADLTKAQFLRLAIRYYVRENPDGIPALYREGSMNEFWAEMME